MLKSSHTTRNIFKLALYFSLGLIYPLAYAKPSLSAERVIFAVPFLGDFSIKIDSLETLAKDGTIEPDLKLYTKLLKPGQIEQLRQLLQKRIEMDAVTVSHLTHTPMGESILKNLGQYIQPYNGGNGFYIMRGAVIKAAASDEGLTPLNVLRQFAFDDIRINTGLVFSLYRDLITLVNYRNAAVTAIIDQENQELASAPPITSEALSPLWENGNYGVQKQRITVENNGNLRQTPNGLANSYSFGVDIYVPDGKNKPSSIIFISYGFGSTAINFSYLAEHLASHGFVVVVPEHIGSDIAYREALMRGDVSNTISPIEFLDRPLDISSTIDKLESLAANDPFWKQKLNLDEIGVVGHSLGGYTVAAIAGGNINIPRLRQECTDDKITLDASWFLQCRASYLPPGNYQLHDPRIKAMISMHGMTDYLFGPENMSQITIPTMLVAASNDVATPMPLEQVHPFIWLNNTHKYLALLDPGTHHSVTSANENPKGFRNQAPQALSRFVVGPKPEVGTKYAKFLNTAFFKVYLDHDQQYLDYLNPNYIRNISDPDLRLHLITSLTPEQLETAYGDKPPEPIIPDYVADIPQKTTSSTVIEDIKRTNVLKVGIRRDAAPFGYIDNQGNWTGYCSDLMSAFANYLTNDLKQGKDIELATIPSSIDNRYQLVSNNYVHLECGPNSITNQIKDITFSNFFWITGTQMLVKAEQTDRIKPLQGLSGVNTGVLENSLTEKFLRDRYPDSKITPFSGNNGRAEGIQSVVNGNLDAFASDGILLKGEANQQGLTAQNYALVPEKPLTCEFYGMIIPKNDIKWQETVNKFLESPAAKQVYQKWGQAILPDLLSDTDYCLNSAERPHSSF